MTTHRYVLSVWEQARVQYVVDAESADDAVAKYERGDVVRPVVDEHDGGDVVDVSELPDQERVGA